MYCHQCKVCKHLEIVVISKKKVMEAAQTGRSRAAVAVVAVAAAGAAGAAVAVAAESLKLH